MRRNVVWFDSFYVRVSMMAVGYVDGRSQIKYL